jgi:hypothetical protein
MPWGPTKTNTGELRWFVVEVEERGHANQIHIMPGVVDKDGKLLGYLAGHDWNEHCNCAPSIERLPLGTVKVGHRNTQLAGVNTN